MIDSKQDQIILLVEGIADRAGRPGAGIWSSMRSVSSTPGRRCPRGPLAPRRFPGSGGFSLLELLIVIGIVTVLVVLVLGIYSRVSNAQQSVACLGTLRNIASAFQRYTHDHSGRYPEPGRANRSWEQLLLRYFAGPFTCPGDSELATTVGSSYDWRDTGRAATTLAGRSMSDITRPDAVLAFEALPGWHARRKINIARIDGSAATVDDRVCFQDLQAPISDMPETEGR